MTHDELLAEINSKIKYCTCDGWGNNCWEDDNQSWLALRAVVELHKPVLWQGIEMVCKDCGKQNYNSAYPCLTIQEIEKAMK